MTDFPLPAQTTIIEELVAAARGSVALLIGDRKAPDYFDFSQRGLLGSFIALIAGQVIGAAVALLMGERFAPGGVAEAMISVVILFCGQVGFSAIVLRQIGRMDGLGPYVVADNWATFFFTIIVALFGGLRVGDPQFFILGIMVLIVEINIARLIVTLSALQIAMFLIAQLVGLSLASIVVGLMFPEAIAEGVAASTLQ